MNENQQPHSDPASGRDQTDTGIGESEGAKVNGSESTLSLLLNEMAGIKVALSELKSGQKELKVNVANVESGQAKLESGQKELNVNVEAWGTKIEGYNDKIAGQDAKIAGQDSKIDGQDSKVEAAIIKVDAQDSKFESQDKAIASQESKIENAGIKSMHKVIAAIVAAILFLIQIWILLPDALKETLTFSNREASNSFLLFLGCTSQMHRVTSAASSFQPIKKLWKCTQKMWQPIAN